MLLRPDFPRIVIAGIGGDSGKTLISLALVRAYRRLGLEVKAFKKGPDYIDAAWLGWAAGGEARNLDTFLMGPDGCLASFSAHAARAGLNVIEGNRGLYDGMDAKGTHSTASLARLLGAPVLVVLSVRKVTATAAAIVKGIMAMDPDVQIRGVILNRVSGKRHERVVKEAIEGFTGVPVLGAIPAFEKGGVLPERHLGLVPIHETADTKALEEVLDEVAGHLDLGKVLEIAQSAPPLRKGAESICFQGPSLGQRVRIALLRDPAFSFYYPENIEALKALGAEVVVVSPLRDRAIPKVDAIIIGGGFPETHGEALANNEAMRAVLLEAGREGVPIYAECGGLMYLARRLHFRGQSWPMCGVFPVDVEVCDRPQGHGYAEAVVDRPNPFFREGESIRGHEFHYSEVAAVEGEVETCYRVTRGQGAFRGRCGLLRWNVLATYIHVHALGMGGWAEGIVRAAAAFRAQRTARDRSS